MKKLTIIAAIAASLALMGCESRAEGEAVSTNGNLRVERLTQVDGCTIYRFKDGTRYHYTTICPRADGVQQASTHTAWSQSCGKSCVSPQDETIDTVVRT